MINKYLFYSILKIYVYIYTRATACDRLAIHNRTMTNHTNDFFSVTRNRPSTCFFAREMSNGRFVRDETIDLSPANFFSFASVSNRNRGNKNTWKFIIVDNDTKILSLPTAPQLFPIPPLTSDRRKIHPHFFLNSILFFP